MSSIVTTRLAGLMIGLSLVLLVGLTVGLAGCSEKAVLGLEPEAIEASNENGEVPVLSEVVVTAEPTVPVMGEVLVTAPRVPPAPGDWRMQSAGKPGVPGIVAGPSATPLYQ